MVIFVVVGLLFLGIGIALGFQARKYGSLVQRIGETPTSQVRDLVPGLVEIQGKVRGKGDLLESPMSGKPCVYYEFKVEERRTRHRSKGGSSSHWVTVVSDRQSVPFLVEDSTGRAEVELKGAEILLERDSHARSGFLNDAPPQIEQALGVRYGRSSVGFIFNKAMRYSERVLEEGEDLFVLGTASREPGKLPRIEKGEDVFVLSDGDEERALSGLRSKARQSGIFAALLCLAGIGAAVLAVLVGK